MLPKIKHPNFEFVIPSTKKKESFRPFLVREEKILLMAKASEDLSEALRAIKQIVNNCCMNTTFDVDRLTIFDLEYLFLQIRAISVNNIVSVSCFGDWAFGALRDRHVPLNAIFGTFAGIALLSIFIVLMIRPSTEAAAERST